MIKNVLENIGGIGVYGTFSICLFFTVFTGMLLRVLRLKPTYCSRMSAIPLSNDNPVSNRQGGLGYE